MLFLGIQGALYYHARTVAVAAGEEALKQGASQYGSAGTGTENHLSPPGGARNGAGQGSWRVCTGGGWSLTGNRSRWAR